MVRVIKSARSAFAKARQSMQPVIDFVSVAALVLYIMFLAGMFAVGPLFWFACLICGALLGFATKVGYVRLKGALIIVAIPIIAKLCAEFVWHNAVTQYIQNIDWIVGGILLLVGLIVSRWGLHQAMVRIEAKHNK